jgi:hypothetical protein
MDNDIEINRLEKLEPKPKSLTLGQTGCVATLDEDGIIHMLNQDGQQLYALKTEHIQFETPTLLVTLNLWFMAWNGGRNQMQQELKTKISELVKLCL